MTVFQPRSVGVMSWFLLVNVSSACSAFELEIKFLLQCFENQNAGKTKVLTVPDAMQTQVWRVWNTALQRCSFIKTETVQREKFLIHFCIIRTSYDIMSVTFSSCKLLRRVKDWAFGRRGLHKLFAETLNDGALTWFHLKNGRSCFPPAKPNRVPRRQHGLPSVNKRCRLFLLRTGALAQLQSFRRHIKIPATVDFFSLGWLMQMCLVVAVCTSFIIYF